MPPEMPEYTHTSKISSLYFAEDYVDLWYDHSNNIIVTTWFDLSTHVHYRQIYTIQLEAVKKYKPFALLIDTSKVFGLPYPKDQEWMAKTILPEVRQLQPPLIINIFPRNAIARMGVKNMIDLGESQGLKILSMPSFEEAIIYIKTRQNTPPH